MNPFQAPRTCLRRSRDSPVLKHFVESLFWIEPFNTHSQPHRLRGRIHGTPGTPRGKNDWKQNSNDKPTTGLRTCPHRTQGYITNRFSAREFLGSFAGCMTYFALCCLLRHSQDESLDPQSRFRDMPQISQGEFNRFRRTTVGSPTSELDG